MRKSSLSRVFNVAAIAGLILANSVQAQSAWSEVVAAAKGQTVYFNAWGGGETSNAYIAWAAKVVQKRFGVTVKHVKISDAAEVVKRV